MSPGEAIKVMLTTSDNMICLHACLRDIISHPGQSFSLSLCGPISISRANAHMVHMG